MTAAAAASSSAASTTTTAAAVDTTATPSAAAASLPLLHRLLTLDTAVSLHLHTHSPIPRPLLKTLEISGDGRFWFPIPLALLPLTSSPHPLLHLLLGLLLDILLVGLLKHLLRRPRPVYNTNMGLTFAVDHWSFPSGHSSRVFFVACWARDWCGGGVIVPAVFGWAAATAVSRVLLGRHFVADVAAGAVLGVVNAVVVFYLFQFLKNEFI